MKIALVCGSSMLYMPYVGNYEKILKQNNVDYTIINWDRFHMENDDSEFKYKDEKNGHKRSYFDYLKFNKFVIKKLNENNYDKIIVFGLATSHFLKKSLIRNYKGKYIVDIRDHHKILKISNIDKLVKESSFTVISSYGYKVWLPKSDKYIINHNTQISSLGRLRPINSKLNDKEIKIACIGAIRDYDVNINFVNSLKNSKNIKVFFYGEGVINKDIKNHLESNSINNALITGRYNKEDEEGLYMNTDLINGLVPNNELNSKTLLPNRLYNAALYGKPIIALDGTYLAELTKEYNLGLVLDSFDKIEGKIKSYLKEFDKNEYKKGRVDFFEKIIKENELFKDSLINFSNENKV